jgi:cysteine desulfurase/selenocysteine lyase
MININKIRQDFPILNLQIYNKPLVYFDNGATTQKPQIVIDEIINCYTKINSNIHRGVHYLSEQSTLQYESARESVRKFINAKSVSEIIFTRGTTEAINLVAFSFSEKYISEGDEIIITEMEHHSNIVPWQMACDRKKAKLKILPFDDNGELLIEELDNLITDRTKIISVTHVSNSMGTINPIKKIIEKAHSHNIPVLIDAAQSVQHLDVDVQLLDCDFLAFSGHKIYAETGIGILYGKEKILEELPPYQGGGDMIKTVSFEKTTWADLPLKFEAGTSNYVGAITLGTAINYIQNIGLKNIAEYENHLLRYATEKLTSIENLKIFGTAKDKTSIISFNLLGIHHYDAGVMLDKLGIAVRTGTHCTEPIMQHFNITGTLRASFAMYNTTDEIDKLYEGILKIKKIFE